MTNGFEFKVASPEEVTAHQEYRFRIFAEEQGYMDDTDCPNKRDEDGFDPYSSLVFATMDGEVAGCCRLTFNNPVGGSYTEKFFLLPPPPADRAKIGEINRFAVSPQFRKGSDSKKVMFGMFRVLYQEAISKGIEYAYLTMHRPFFTLLRRFGIPFVMIDGYQIRPYSGYYSKYFDPADTLPSIILTEAFGAYLHYHDLTEC